MKKTSKLFISRGSYPDSVRVQCFLTSNPSRNSAVEKALNSLYESKEAVLNIKTYRDKFHINLLGEFQ
jgi:hypothetical protein